MTHDQRDEQLFIVRLWQESHQGAPAGRRGYVEHVGSKQRLYFSDFADLNDFLRFRVGAPSPLSTSESPAG